MKIALLASAFFLFSGFLNLAHAQYESDGVVADSSTYDLGRITIKKRNLQAVTIKAADLEKMPFTDVKDAINIYTNGIYSAHQDYVYVIDGLLNADINTYSIYDIDEITLVQNAAAVMNGVDGSKTLILVKTKHGGAEDKGITVAGQSDFIRLVKRSPYIFNNSQVVYPKTNDMYHQYYISAYGNSEMIKAGVSAEIMHNTIPFGAYIKTAGYSMPFSPTQTNRFKFNGFMDAKLGESNLLTVDVGYVPQRDAAKDNGTLQNVVGQQVTASGSFYNSQNLFYTDVKLSSTITEGLTNKLSVGFNRLRDNGEFLSLSGGSVTNTGSYRRDSLSSVNSLIAKDDISYRAVLDDIVIQPNANFTFRQVDNFHEGTYGGSISGGGIHNFTDNIYPTKQKLGILTPSLTVSYLDWLTVQGGFQLYVNSSAKATALHDNQTQPLPFATFNVDLFTPFDMDTDEMRLNLYGSYAQNFNYSNDIYGTLMDDEYLHPGNNAKFDTQPDPYKINTQIQGGAVFSVLENKLSFSYNYDLKTFNAVQVILIMLPSYQNVFQNTDARVELHRVGIDFTLPTEGDFNWRTSINGTYVFLRDNYKIHNYMPEYLRLTYPDKPFITGGFVNSLRFKDAFMDFGIIYALNQGISAHPQYSQTYIETGKANVFDLQNIDLGYKLPVKAVKSLSVYASARNLVQSNQSKYTENRRYIGAGFKVEL